MSLPLVMLPGLVLDRRLFEAQINALGGGVPAEVADLAVADTIGGVASAVLARAPEQFALLGLSMGGYTAFEILRQAPERVARLALLDTQARPDDAAARERREGQIREAGSGGFEPLMEGLYRTWVHPDRHDDARLRGLVMEMARGFGPAGFTTEMRAIISRPDSRPLLASIGCPTLVLCGREDFATVDAHVEMATGIPDATLAVLPNCGHLSPIERPEAVGAQLRLWLGLG
jgi:pimeloyl-ACP methyl ester carboxylesterase